MLNLVQLYIRGYRLHPAVRKYVCIRRRNAYKLCLQYALKIACNTFRQKAVLEYTCTSRIFEDFDWAPVLFIQDVQRKTYDILLWKYFFSKNQKSVTEVLRRIESREEPPWQNFRKLSSFSINGRIWLTFKVYCIPSTVFHVRLCAASTLSDIFMTS
jgi:hypothetical protein